MSRPATKGKRFFKLAGMTASVAGRYASTRVKGLFQDDEQRQESRRKANADSGGRIAQTLGELKGAVMKVGQMASIAADVLPKEVSDALGRLQKEAPPVSYSVIEEQVVAELGTPPEALFERFDRAPFASASIGQVHRARTDDGREVVVKVQYPGVDEAVDSDLAHLKIALRASGLVKLEKKSLDATFQELRDRLHEELDYCIEADNVRRFREFHLERHPFVAIPEVVGERSSQRVLTMTYLTGRPMSEVNELGYTREERNRLGWNLLMFMVSEIFVLQAIHADPNPGNFALRKDGTVVVYDFGCVKELPPHIVLAYRDMITQGLAENYDASHDALDRLGLIRPGAPHVGDAYYKEWRDIFANPFLNDNCFDFGRSDVHDQVITMVPGVIKRMGSFQPSKDLIFLDRMIAGHYGNLCALRAQVAVLPLVRPFLDSLQVELPEDAQAPAFPPVLAPPAPD